MMGKWPWLVVIVIGVAAVAGAVAMSHPWTFGAWRVGFGLSGDSRHGLVLSKACAACHGANGSSANSSIPKLAGQKATYLDQQLLDFKSGARASPVMHGVAASLSSSDVADLSAYYASQAAGVDAAPDEGVAERGEQIFNRPTSAAPPCAACHGKGLFGGGMMGGAMMGGGAMRMMRSGAVAPWLFGQHAAYLVDQLDAFATGSRRGAVMGPISAALTPSERRQVAAYVSAVR